MALLMTVLALVVSTFFLSYNAASFVMRFSFLRRSFFLGQFLAKCSGD